MKVEKPQQEESNSLRKRRPRSTYCEAVCVLSRRGKQGREVRKSKRRWLCRSLGLPCVFSCSPLQHAQRPSPGLQPQGQFSSGLRQGQTLFWSQLLTRSSTHLSRSLRSLNSHSSPDDVIQKVLSDFFPRPQATSVNRLFRSSPSSPERPSSGTVALTYGETPLHPSSLGNEVLRERANIKSCVL